jgi:hypothetical protein
MSNISISDGRTTELATLSKIKPGHTLILRELLAHGDDLTAHILADIETIHYCQWIIVSLGAHDYLMFISNFTGSFEKYIDDFASVIALAVGLHVIWGNCEDWPGIGSVENLKAFIRSTTIGADLYYSAYPEATVRDVLKALKATAVVEEFVALA